MDILYYSNFCKHCQKVIQILAKNNFTDKISYICIDSRIKDPKTNQILVKTQNGKMVVLPPNIHSVPALLMVSQKYRIVLGDEILNHYLPTIKEQNKIATEGQGEPSGYQLMNSNSGMNIVSEQYTYYNMTPDELSAKGSSQMRQMHNYVSASHNPFFINTPDDSYKPDKIGSAITIDKIEQTRNEDINKIHVSQTQTPFL